ncbi:DMT family transporter [Cohnella sp. GCM10020058]|uniref:DMT family transporter n=1 Tax=Cohnella sp. GCM10020058 TaxID=3317330 RepID=UPI003645EFC4
MTIAFIFVLCSGLAHALWNLFAKQSEDKAVFLWAIYAPATVLLLPSLVAELVQARYAAGEWLLLGASLGMQALYAVLLSLTYKAGDLSQVYPLMRGMPTLLVPLAGALLLGERMPPWGWIGIGCMLVGFLVMIGRSPGGDTGREFRKPIALAVCVGLCIASYTLIDKINLQHISPLALLEVTNIGFMLGLTPAACRRGRLRRTLRNHWRTLWLGTVLSPGSYLLFLLAAGRADVSAISPVREVGIVFGTLFGLFILKERQGVRRVTASAAVAAGIILVASSAHGS